MASLLNYTLFTFYFIAFSTFISISDQTFSEDVSEYFAVNLIQKTTRLHFYFHDIVTSKIPTAKKVIGIDPYGFGTVFIMDDALTEGPDRTSKLVGKAQGMYAVASQSDLALLMVVNFAFTEGKYNGSCISVLGRNHVPEDVRELPIVGGSGLFRFARGYALARTISFDRKSANAVVEYNLTVMHF